ncbi:hypothetical protein [Pseudomonas protegens]|uniref:hypothetical protein n=1 Tax=Pseudomonas protegens TaxID=380021 RepID=UPI000F48A9CA|nr:hypothetical protein [Pseudomonas protegens]ROL86595.1 hypothetical protein BK639_28780 [Pseudomonas protegens]ROL95071.1 hypothetical protein BK640_28650 [Pseudomonas protegens]ROL97944.1 hypothetical protein BK641_27445 [Pseudomonas protegens]ROM07730.1 hypothetical protein BK642_14345 [Pseudomonas protegens]
MSGWKIPEPMIVRTLWALWWLMFGSAALWLLVGSVAFWVKHEWLPPDTSGWVQGLGAILAIAIAIAVPWYQKKHDADLKEQDKLLLEIARSEQLLCLCEEFRRFLEEEPYDNHFADYRPSNEMRRSILTDQLARLTETQKGELNSERMDIGLNLRFQIHDWLKYFGGDEGAISRTLYDRVEHRRKDFVRIRDRAENVVRKLKASPLEEIEKPTKGMEETPS